MNSETKFMRFSHLPPGGVEGLLSPFFPVGSQSKRNGRERVWGLYVGLRVIRFKVWGYGVQGLGLRV